MPESLFPPNRHPASVDDIFRFLPDQLGTAGTTNADIKAVLMRFDFAEQARYAHKRGDDVGADALMRLANEITPQTVRFMAARSNLINGKYSEERIPGFVAAHYTGGRGEVHIPRIDSTALSQVELPESLRPKSGSGE